jgi:formylglycine-generating enzyme required for sulfatase activity
MEMVKVQRGEFSMGSNDADALWQEKPAHVHVLRHDSWIGRNDVTRSQYLAYCKAMKRPEPELPSYSNRDIEVTGEHPVTMVSWEDANDYATWAGLMLPLEEEWEKAARGEDGRKYPWGDEWDPPLRCNYADASFPVDQLVQHGQRMSQIFEKLGYVWDREHSDGFAFTSPVGSFPRGVSPVGALDMSGNVGQWCADWFVQDIYVRYYGGDFTPPATGETRVARGGGHDDDAKHNRCSCRNGVLPTYKNSALGFRASLRSR